MTSSPASRVAHRFSRLAALLALIFLAATSGCSGEDAPTITEDPSTPPPPATGVAINVDPSVEYQRMTGWEAVTQIGELECDHNAFLLYRAPLLDAAVNDLGLNRVRLQLRSGLENNVDWFAQYQAGQIDRATWRTHWFEVVNDNANPNVLNASGVHWGFLDYTIDNVVTHLRQRLAARGERLYVNLNYVDFGNSPFEHSTNPAEYAELVVAAFQHIQSKYGWSPDAVEMILEPDNTPNWNAATIGPAIVATGDRLAAAGFHPAFIAPSNSAMSSALLFFDQLITMPRVREYLTDLSYHRYGGVTSAILQSIGDRAVQYGIRTAMLEHIGSGYEDLHADLLQGRNSAWQQFALAYCGSDDNGGVYYMINQSNPSAPSFSEGSRTRFLKQYFRHVRLGAIRVGATSGDNRFSPLAFRNTDGRFVVVIKSEGGDTLQVRGLPAGTYGIYYAGPSASGVSPDVTIAAQQPLAVTTPNGNGVITVYRK